MKQPAELKLALTKDLLIDAREEIKTLRHHIRF